MTGVIATIPRIQFSGPLGVPLIGGKLYTYLAGTTTPEPTFQDEALTIANPNPVELDSTGSCTLWLDPAKKYKFLLRNALGVTQPGWPVDDINGAAPGDFMSSLARLDGTSKVKGTWFSGLIGAISDLATSIGASLVGYANGGAAVSVQDGLDVLYYGVANVRSKRFAGGAKGDGVASDSAAIRAASASLPAGGVIFFPPGHYVMDGNDEFTSLPNQTWEGVGFASKITIKTGDLIFKSPAGLKLSRLHFAGSSLNSVQQSVCISNFAGATVSECKFSGFGGGTFNKAGSTCLYLIATDTTTAQFASGNSSGGVVSRCLFEGNGRLTNFALRIYSDFVNVGTSTNTGAIVSNCTFNEFNWNALELAGPGVSGAVVSNCVANLCGLCPFDIDKGAHDNKMTNLTINRLLGNIDPVANPNTRAAGVAISGSLDTGPYAYNNVVDGVVINLRASDLALYQGRGTTAVNVAYVKDSTVRNVRMRCDAVPTRQSSAAFALAAVCFETCSGVTIEGVQTVNASNGIIEVGTFNSQVGADPVRIQGITNTGTMKGEAIYAPNSTYGTNRYLFADISMSTDMTDPQSAARNACVVLENPSVGNGNLGVYILHKLRIYCSSATAYGIYAGAYRMAIDDVSIGLASQGRFFAPASPMLKLFASTLGSSAFGNDALDVSQAFANLSASCSVNIVACGDSFPLIPGVGDGRLYTSAIPTNPPNALWVRPATLDYISPVSGGYMGLVMTPAGWKQHGAIL